MESKTVQNPDGSATSSKIQQCPYYEYSTTNKTALSKHVCIHTGGKPLACLLCPTAFSQRGNLKSHIRTHAREKSFACAHCPYRASQKNTLAKHILTIHKNFL